MKCPYCGEEMIRGYLMSSRDITFAVDNLTKVFRIKKSDDLELSKGSEGILIVKLIVAIVAKDLIDYAIDNYFTKHIFQPECVPPMQSQHIPVC